MNRRHLVMASVGGVAAVAGAIWAWSQDAEYAFGDGSENFWAMRFSTPSGGQLSMSSFRGRPLVVNFWATWCAPCIRELPALEHFQREFGTRGWQVLGLALDRESPVREFLAKTPLGFPIALAGVEGTELALRLGNHRGGLPFSVVYDAQGRPRHTKLGELDFDELRGWARGSAAVQTSASAGK